MDLSIIVPVYNVERYIRPCLESIFLQGLNENRFEVIIVNDGTKDRSMEVIQDFIEQQKNITIINQENQGLSVARNNGIAVAKGEYVFMPDSDDLLIENSLATLLEIAINTKVDMVVADFLIMNNEEIDNFQGIIQNDIKVKEKTGEQLTLEDLNPHQCYVWRTLFRKDFLLVNHITFFPGVFYQDVPFTHECFIKANRCIRTNRLLNIYRKGRQESATSSFTLKNAKDLCMVIAKTWELTKITELNPRIDNKVKQDIWTSFSLMTRRTCDYIKDDSERVEIIDYLRQLAPNLSFTNGKKQKTVTFLYRNMPHTFIRLRYLYGKIIEGKIMPLYYQRLRRPFIRKWK